MNRFYYSHSTIYGWCVYDREYFHSPAYEACGNMLPRQTMADGTQICISPVMLPSEYRAMSLCSKLNRLHKKMEASA